MAQTDRLQDASPASSACPSPDATLALLAQLPAKSRDGLVHMYRQSLDDQLRQIQSGLAADVAEASLVATVHRLAGGAGMMQDQGLCEVARAMESALRESRIEAARLLWPLMSGRAGATLAALAQAYPATP